VKCNSIVLPAPMSIDQIANGRMWTNDMSMNVWRPASSMEPSSATLDSSVTSFSCLALLIND